MGVTLQINLAPFDHRHAAHLIPHHIETFGRQVEEVLLVYDEAGKRAAGGRERERANSEMKAVLERLSREDPRVTVCGVGYDERARREVSEEFSAAGLLPLYDFRGAPFYQYFFGLHAARFDHVLHLDSDMFFGGGGACWVEEAMKVMSDPRVLAVSPLPGPPRADGRLIGQVYRPYGSDAHSYAFDTFSTRVFFVDRKKLARGITSGFPGVLPLGWALLKGYPVRDTAEKAVTALMRKRGLIRVDFLGSGGGVWSLHPLYRSEGFYSQIPAIIRRLKEMDIPAEQYGYYNFTDDFIDWTDARRALK
jgi:hypothetical protein